MLQFVEESKHLFNGGGGIGIHETHIRSVSIGKSLSHRPSFPKAPGIHHALQVCIRIGAGKTHDYGGGGIPAIADDKVMASAAGNLGEEFFYPRLFIIRRDDDGKIRSQTESPLSTGVR